MKNIKKKVLNTIKGKSDKVYKLYGTNYADGRLMCRNLNLNNFKLEEIESVINRCSKIVRMNKLFAYLDFTDIGIDKAIFLSKLYFKKNKTYYKFGVNKITKTKDLYKLLDFYYNNLKLSLFQIFKYLNGENYKEAYEYFKLKKYKISESDKDSILNRVINYGYAKNLLYFLHNSDFKNNLDILMNKNFETFTFDVDYDNVFIKNNYALLKKLKDIYEKNNKYNEFIELISKRFNCSAPLADIFDNLNIPRKHIYIARKVAPNYFFSKKNPDPNLGLFI